jgi:hypothetical protein
VIGLISAAGGTQGLQAINTMEFAVRALRGWGVPYVIPVASAFRVFDIAWGSARLAYARAHAHVTREASVPEGRGPPRCERLGR